MTLLLEEQFTSKGCIAFRHMVNYSVKYPKNFFGQSKINIRHSLLVRDLAVHLQMLRGGNLEVLEVAAFFHDLGKVSTVEGHEELIIKLLEKHRQDFQFSTNDYALLLNTCRENDDSRKLLEYKILHNADNLAFLYDFQYQEAFYRYIGTKTLLFEKRMKPKCNELNLEEARSLGSMFYKNAVNYWKNRPELAPERYRPEIEGRTFHSLTDLG